VTLNAPNVRILPVEGDPKSLLRLSQKELDTLRAPFLSPLKVNFSAPNQVALYLFRDGSWVIENFTDESVKVELNQQLLNRPRCGEGGITSGSRTGSLRGRQILWRPHDFASASRIAIARSARTRVSRIPASPARATVGGPRKAPVRRANPDALPARNA
jgi:hypothetical protein